MSRTFKDRPYKYGGDRHKYFCCNNHGSHGKFVRLMSRLRRRHLQRSMQADPDMAEKRSHWRYLYFD